MAEKRGGLTGRTGRRVVVKANGKEVPGISNFSIAVGEAPTDTTAAFEGSFTTVGEAPIGDVTFTVVSYLPNHGTWKSILKAQDDGDIVAFVVETPERQVFPGGTGLSTSGHTAAVAKTGVVTLANSADNMSGKEPFEGDAVQRGMVLQVGETGDKLTIESITLDAAGSLERVEVEAVAKDVSAGEFRVLIPKLQWSFNAQVKQSGSVEGGVDTAIGSSLVVTPTAKVAAPTIV